nr:helix-turn-helix transcriptional regulator [Scytonema hofmannii]
MAAYQMSYKRIFSRKDRIASRFLAQVHAEIANAAVSAKAENGLTQKKVAEELGVDKSVVSRILKGLGNPTIRTIGELTAVLGYRPELVLHKVGAAAGNNALKVHSYNNKVVVAYPSTATSRTRSQDSSKVFETKEIQRADQ